MAIFNRLREGLVRTKEAFIKKVESVVKSAVEIDEEFYENLEEILLLSDVGMVTAQRISEGFYEKYATRRPTSNEQVMDIIREVISEIFTGEDTVVAKPFAPGLNVVMVTGINGSGKTTTIGKLAAKFKQEGKSVMLAACDTFRAAAVEQLQIWADRSNVPLIKGAEGVDPSSVMFDAVMAAKAQNVDILLADTAGRLHTQVNLMQELRKIKRIATEKAGAVNFQSWIVLDSTIGQNALSQVKLFNEAVGIDALVVTKLDGTARGGVVLSIINEWKLPISYIGVGEKIDDLMPFNAVEFAHELLASDMDGYWEKRDAEFE